MIRFFVPFTILLFTSSLSSAFADSDESLYENHEFVVDPTGHEISRALRSEQQDDRRLNWASHFSFGNLWFRIGACKPEPRCPFVDPSFWSCGCPDCSKPHHFDNIKTYCYNLMHSSGGDDDGDDDYHSYDDDNDDNSWNFNNDDAGGGDDNNGANDDVGGGGVGDGDGSDVDSSTSSEEVSQNAIPTGTVTSFDGWIYVALGAAGAILAAYAMRNQDEVEQVQTRNAVGVAGAMGGGGGGGGGGGASGIQGAFAGLMAAMGLAGLLGMKRRGGKGTIDKQIELRGNALHDDGSSTTGSSTSGGSAKTSGGMSAAFAGVMASMRRDRSGEKMLAEEVYADEDENYVLADDDTVITSPSAAGAGAGSHKSDNGSLVASLAGAAAAAGGDGTTTASSVPGSVLGSGLGGSLSASSTAQQKQQRDTDSAMSSLMGSETSDQNPPTQRTGGSGRGLFSRFTKRFGRGNGGNHAPTPSVVEIPMMMPTISEGNDGVEIAHPPPSNYAV